MIIQQKRLFLSTFFLCLCLLSCYAQGKHDSIPLASKWEVGIDLLPLLKLNQLPAKSLFFRRNYHVSPNRCNAWRLRLGTDSENRLVETFNQDDLIGDYQSFAPYLRLGHEWRFISGRYAWFTGIDFMGRYEHTNWYRLTDEVNNKELFTDEKIRNYDIGFSWIIGGSLKFSKHLGVSIESSLDALYIRRKSDAVDIIRDSNVIVAYGGENHKRLTTNIQPLLSININYSIQKFHKK
jgi:hypothetical protein